MSGNDLAEFLALLHDSDRLLESFHGEVRDWVRPMASNALVVDWHDLNAGRPRVRSKEPGLFPRTQEVRRRVWFKRPDRLRMELFFAGKLVRFGVRREALWWRWDRNQGTTSGRLGPGQGQRPVPPLLDPAFLSPARLIGMFRFEVVGLSVWRDREVLRARAERRAERYGKTTQSYEFEFEFDLEHGTMLRRAVSEDGRRVGGTEVLDARFDVSIDPELFIFALPGAPA